MENSLGKFKSYEELKEYIRSILQDAKNQGINIERIYAYTNNIMVMRAIEELKKENHK